MLPSTYYLKVTAADLENLSDHPARDPIAKAIKRDCPYLREVWVADQGIYLQNYGIGVKSASITLDHDDATRAFLKALEAGQPVKPFRTMLKVRSIKPTYEKSWAKVMEDKVGQIVQNLT